MQILLLVFLLVFTEVALSQGCVVGTRAKHHQYVCFDGRTLHSQGGQLIWYAKRGCFKSATPCCTHQANHYGRYRNSGDLAMGLAQCRYRYPFRLGEMQTH